MKDRLEYVIVLFFVSFFLILPLSFSLWLGARLGDLAYCFSRRYRNVAIQNLRSVFSEEKEEKEIRNIARRTFQNLGKNVVEFARFSKLNKDNIDRFINYEGKENLDLALQEKKGVLLLGAHFGNWELLGAAIGLKGYPVNVITRHLNNRLVDSLVNKQREQPGVKVIPHRGSAKKILKCLKRNELVGILLDQNTSWKEGVFIDFFNKKASTNFGLALLAMKTKVPVVPTFIIRQENGKHKVVYDDIIELSFTGNRNTDLKENTQRFTKIIESYVRKYPDQWFWVHRRWKTQPR